MRTDSLLPNDRGTGRSCAADIQGLGSTEGRHLDAITDGLRRLIAQGFRFAHPRDAQGGLVAVIGIRAHHDVIDIVQLYGEKDADAARIPSEEPDILAPRRVLWSTSGPALDVVDAMLALPDLAEEVDRVHPRAQRLWLPAQPSGAASLTAFA